MTYKIKRKYIYVFQLLSPFFTLYKIFCVCACVCVLWIINVNQYSAMLFTQTEKKKKKKKANRLVTRIQSFSAFLITGIQTHTTYNILLSRKDLILISSCDPTGACHMVLITFHYPRNNSTIRICIQTCSWIRLSMWLFSVTVIRPDFPVGPIRGRFTRTFALNNNRLFYFLSYCSDH